MAGMLAQLIDDVADALLCSGAVLLRAPSGAGKGFVMRRVYEQLKLRGALVEVNCSHLRGDVARSELLGHEAGAFTGASRRSVGLLEQANDGLLVLDEVATLSQVGQETLLTALEGDWLRVGGVRASSQFLLVCATNEPLEEMVADGRFRSDFYYRIAHERFTIPPLEERPEDILAIAEAWIAERARLGHIAKGSRMGTSAKAAIVHLDFSRGQARAVQAAVGRALRQALREVGRERDVPLVLAARHFDVDDGLSAEASRALAWLRRRGAPAAQGEIAQAIGLGKTKTMAALRELEAAGLAVNEARRWGAGSR